MKKMKDLTEGSIIKSLVTLSIPITLANILQTAYQLTDTYWVWKLWTNAVAAVSISFPLIFLMISLGWWMAMAGTILVAQYKWRKDQDSVNHITSQTLMIVFFISSILSIIWYILSLPLIKLMWTEADVIPDAVSYMQISFIWMIFMFTYMVFQGLMRWIWEVKIPAIIVLGTVLLNLVLDPLFIFGYWPIPSFWVSGAAVATIWTQWIAAIVWMLLLIKWKFHIQIHIKDLKPDFKLMKKMFFIWLPSSIEQSTRGLWMTVMTFLVASFGTSVVAAYGIWTRILMFTIIPAMWISMATSTLVGQNIWAQKIDRAEKIVWLSTLASFIFLTIVGLITFLFAEQISAIFIPWEVETIKLSTSFVKLMALSFGFIWIQMSLNWAFRWAGETTVSMVLSIVSVWVLQFPLAYILSNQTGLWETGLWISYPVSNVLGGVITILWFIRGDWKRNKY